MSNIIIIQAETKLASDARLYFKELDESNEIKISTSIEDFYSTYFGEEITPEEEQNETSEEEAPESSTNPEKKDEARMATIDLIFFDPELLPSNLSVSEWIVKTKSEIKLHNYYTEEVKVKFVVSLNESDVSVKNKYTIPSIEDIIYSPYDRLLFLQKMEITLALPKKVSPSYLFNQTLLRDIEISKKIPVTRMSNCGISIVNPVALKPGTKVHFYLTINKEKTISFYGVAGTSRPYSENNNFFEVDFLFFGTPKETIKEVRLFFSKEKSYTGLKENEGSKFIFDELNIFVSEEDKRTREVIVLDVEEASSSNIKDLIESEVFNTVVATETSYRSFLNKYIAGSDKKEISSEDYASNSDLSLGSVVFHINSETKDLTKVESAIGGTDTILNTPMSQYFSEGQDWLKLISSEESKELLEEALHIIENKNNMSKLIQLDSVFTSPEDQDQEVTLSKFFILEFTMIKGTTSIKIEIKPPDSAFIKKLKLSEERNPKLKKFDLMIIDHRLIPLNPAKWIENINEILKKKGLIKDRLNIIVTGDNIDPIAKEFSRLDIDGLFNKPLPISQFLVTTVQKLNTEFSKYNISNVAWQDVDLNAFVALDGQIESLSEYGATLRLKNPITTGANLYLHGFIYDQAPNKSLCIKFYHCEEHSTEKNIHSCSVIYFGINEFFLKYIRTWIRENYATEKEREQNS